MTGLLVILATSAGCLIYTAVSERPSNERPLR